MKNTVTRSAVGIATGYGLDDRGLGVRVPVGCRISTSPFRLDRLWGPPNLLPSGYWGMFPEDGILHSHCRENLKPYMLMCKLYLGM
jgi:hypothetical protein